MPEKTWHFDNMLRPRRKARKQLVIFIETCSWLKPAFIIFVFIFYKF